MLLLKMTDDLGVVTVMGSEGVERCEGAAAAQFSLLLLR